MSDEDIEQTYAYAFGALFGQDGGMFYTRDGRSMDELLAEEGIRGRDIGDGRWRFEWIDGSAIIVAGDAWDYAFPQCNCWHGIVHQYGHDDDCPNSNIRRWEDMA